MIDWAGLKRATSPLFARLMGLTLAQLRWSDEAEGGAWTQDPHAELTITLGNTIGQDEERQDDSAAGDVGGPTNDVTVIVCGPRTFTLTVAVESIVQDIGDKRSAQLILENLKTRLGRTTSIEALTPWYAISDWSGTKRVPYRDKEGRLINRYVADFFCLTADNDTDTTPDAGGWIGEVIGSGTVTPDGGNPIAVNFDVKEE